jgi:hypothetical protein
MCSAIRKVLRYQKSNQKPSIEDEQTTQWKFTKGQTKIHKALQRKLKIDHNHVLSSFMTYNCFTTMSNAKGTSGGEATAYPSGAHELTYVL